MSMRSNDSNKLLKGNSSDSLESTPSSPLENTPQQNFKIKVSAPKSMSDDDIISDYEECKFLQLNKNSSQPKT